MSSSHESRLARQLARLLALFAGGGLLLLLLAACGGSSDDPGSGSSEASREQKAEQQFADFARCLREHGVEAEAISHQGGGHGIRITAHGTPGAGPQSAEAAEKACKKYRPEPQKVNLSPQQKVEREEQVRKFAACMREHGVKIHAEAHEGRVAIQIGGPGSGVNPGSATFQKAQEACHNLLPGGGPKGLPTGPPKGPPPSGGEGAHSESHSESGFSAGS